MTVHADGGVGGVGAGGGGVQREGGEETLALLTQSYRAGSEGV